jgi:outer membrane protein
MLKKNLLFALLLIPAMAFAQESQKIAYFKFYDVLTALPEYIQMQDSLKKQAAVFQSEMEILNEEYTKKTTAFQEQQETLVELIKARKIQEIEDLRERAVTFQQQAQQQQEQLQQALFAPIQTKILKAVEEVGTENHFAYILEGSNGLLYISPQSPDATPLVRTKLGLK